MDPKPIKNKVLRDMYSKLSPDSKTYDKFDRFLTILAEAESFSGKKMKSDKSSAKGYYHFTDASLPTARTRLGNIYKSKGMDAKEVERLMSGDVMSMSQEDQSILVLANLMEGPKAPFKDWVAGKVSDADLYYYGHHTDDPNAISSKGKVYENWYDAANRLGITDKKPVNLHQASPTKQKIQEGTSIMAYGKPEGYVEPDPEEPQLIKSSEYMDPMMKLIHNIYFGAKDNIPTVKKPKSKIDSNQFPLGGEILSAAGGPLGAANMAAGMAGDLLGAFLPKPSFNNVANSSDYSFGKDATKDQAQKMAGINSGIDIVTNELGKIPVVGGFAKLAGQGVKGIAGLFGNKSSDEDKMAEYMSMFRQENEEQRKSNYANANWAAMGGELSGMSEEGVQEITTGGTHEQNPNGGVFVGMGANGKPNTVEEGEIVVDFPGGKKFVFTNRF